MGVWASVAPRICLVDMVDPDWVFNSLELIGTWCHVDNLLRDLDGHGACWDWSGLEGSQW